MLQTVKRATIDDKKLYKYVEDLFDELSPQIKEEIAKGGEPVFMGFLLVQQGRPHVKYLMLQLQHCLSSLQE